MTRKTFLLVATFVCLGVLAAFQPVRGQTPIAARHESTEDTATIRVPGLKKPLVVFHIADTHISVPSKSEAEYRQYSARMDDNYSKERKHYKTGKKALPVEHFRQLLDAAKQRKVDLIALTGDIVNNPSQSSVEYVSQMLKKTGIPYLYISGNHDWHYEGMSGSDDSLRETWIQKRLLPLYLGRDPLCYAVEVDGINFVAIDNSTYQVNDKQLAFFEKEIARGLPTVLLVHIPIWTTKTKSTTTFARRVKVSGNLIAVLAGHEHQPRADAISASAVQYVVRAAFVGGYRLVTFEPAGQDEKRETKSVGGKSDKMDSPTVLPQR